MRFDPVYNTQYEEISHQRYQKAKCNVWPVIIEVFGVDRAEDSDLYAQIEL